MWFQTFAMRLRSWTGCSSTKSGGVWPFFPHQPCHIWGFHKFGGTPKWIVYKGKFQSKMDENRGYPYFRKPPYHGTNHLSTGDFASIHSVFMLRVWQILFTMFLSNVMWNHHMSSISTIDLPGSSCRLGHPIFVRRAGHLEPDK